ncbi:hypothetical protein AB0M29_45125 [Streptomyces sp. NPDC051976]|uniref:hypothetical protein n=1 Tax=Streptomyces sp. NPDC051976 TaxID=3154947 RepID=UPI0034315BC3
MNASGHYLDTGEGPAQLDPSPQATAWDTYKTHADGCTQCQTSVWRCKEGDRLWNTYIQATP